MPDADRATLARPEAVAQRIVALLGTHRFSSGERIAVGAA
jgi:hypothetical protein